MYLKKKIFKLAAGSLLLIILAACGNSVVTEDETVCLNEEVLNEEAGSAEVLMEQMESEIETEPIIQVYKDVFTCVDENINVKVDVNMENIHSKMSILKGTVRDIEMEDVKLWTKTFFGDTEMYEGVEASDIDRAIDTDWSFHDYTYYFPNEYYENAKYFSALGNIGGRTAQISAMNRIEEMYSVRNISFAFLEEASIESDNVQGLTDIQADTMVSELMGQLGLEEWTLYNKFKSSSKSQINEDKCDKFVYTLIPVYNDICAFYKDLVHIKYDDVYAANCYYEHLVIYIKNGAIESVNWYSPLMITGEYQNNIQVLSNNEVVDKMKSYIQEAYSLERFSENMVGSIMTGNIDIIDAQFRMMRVKSKDTNDFLIIPVWQFVGDVYVDTEYATNYRIWKDQVLAVINAVDGSIINADLGY